MENEIWKDVEGFSGYQISNLGRVKSLRFNKESILKPGINNCGYYVICLHKNNIQKQFLIHRLVANAFIKNKYKKLTVNHKNGIKSNNHISNLEWATAKENIQHAWQTGLCKNTRKNAIIASEAAKKPVYSKKLDLKFESTVEAANYLQSKYFEDINLASLEMGINYLLKNKIKKSKYDFGWSYINE